MESVAATLGNSSRLLRLISYIGENYFQGRADKLHEYEIATEVFGRSKTTFNPGEDAIVRVEAHRLRKKLREYYENEGKDHSVQLSIPPGSYAPVFVRRPGSAEAAPSEVAPPRRAIPFWIYATAALVLIVFTSYFALKRPRTEKQSSSSVTSSASAVSPPAGMAFAKMPLRILAGYYGKPQVDSTGAVWQPDEYSHYGGTWSSPGVTVQRTDDSMLFEHWRNGDFSYDIPLRPGVYELHLYFVTEDPNPASPATFYVSVNGKPLLSGFDINFDALGSNIADERVFRDISPGADGLLHLKFASERAPAMLNAIEVLPGTPHKLLPIRIVTQAKSFTDHNGQFWRPDDYFMGGFTLTRTVQIAGASDPELYAAERYGHFTYAIPVDTRDEYTLILHFAEFYFGMRAAGTGGAGSREFRVLCNGNTLLDNFDIYKEVGDLQALTKTFHHLRPTAQGKLNLTFEPIVNNATVSGIEVLDESQ